MADIFLSYAREDRASAERIAEALAGRGYDVWWDPDIPAGPSYTQVIEQALTSAKCVLVLWSATSVASNWVQDEAREAQERGVLVAARLAEVKPPLGFRGHQLADLAAWDGGTDAHEFRRLLRGIEAHVPPAKPAPQLSPSSPPAVLSPREAIVSGESGVPGMAAVLPEASTPREVAAPVRVSSASPTSVPPADLTPRPAISPVPPSVRPRVRETFPAESTVSGVLRSEGQDESPAPGEAAPSAIAAFFGRLNGPTIAAVVAVIALSGMLVLLRDQAPSPTSSSAVTSPSSTPLADPPDGGGRPTSAAPSRPDEAAAGPARSTTPPPVSAAPAPAAAAPAKASATPRFRADAWQLPDEPLLGFIEVPAGPFTMGSDKGQDSKAQDNEMPQHQVSLPAYFIGRYPVTVAQYKACVADGGCDRSERRALEGDGDRPVANLSWYDAVAYTTWLEAKLKAWAGTPGPIADALAGHGGGVPGPWTITLPSEAEWERAARGTDARIYPWGTRLTRSRADYGETLARVGAHPAGASAVGAMDMTGNVNEWTRSIFRKYPYAADDGRERIDAPGSPPFRVLRGGSVGASDGRPDFRAAFRGQAIVDATAGGFRVAIIRVRSIVALIAHPTMNSESRSMTAARYILALSPITNSIVSPTLR